MTIADFLSEFRYKDKGLFILGCFCRHVTIYSQQIRALNLVYCLNHISPLDRKKVVVVGGGIAGLTTAAAALARGATVTVLEKEEEFIPLQTTSRQRYVHPHVYDWPNEETVGYEANLPFLNWSANTAHIVADQLREQWVKCVDSYEAYRADPKVGVSNVAVEPRDSFVTVSWYDKDGRRIDDDFDIAILAVGFGVEKEDGYWVDSGIDTLYGPNETWLVSGTGDSGLTDLMRLCIRNFRHASIVERFENRTIGDSTVRVKIQQIERDPRAADRAFLTSSYRDINDIAVQEFLKKELRGNSTVTLTGETPYMFGPDSSALNRFIVSQLARLGAFSYIPGGIAKPPRHELSQYVVEFRNGNTIHFDKVVIKHGPEPALKQFKTIWPEFGGKYLEWKAKPHFNDETRKRMWPQKGYWPEPEPVVEVVSAGFEAVIHHDIWPTLTSECFGRNRYLKALDTAWTKSRLLFWLYGDAGEGKTAILREWFDHHAPKLEGIEKGFLSQKCD